MIWHRAFLVVRSCLAFVLGAAMCVQADAAWELTRFELFQGKPVKSDDWREQESESLLRFLPGMESLSDDNIRETEQFLHEVAEKLSKWGFADPLAEGYFDSVVTRDDGTRAIRVYYFPVQGLIQPYAWYSPGLPCAEPPTPRKVINLNASKYARNGRITDMNYQTLAHELFHAVQFSSEYSKKLSCVGVTWISEGSADAIGTFLARDLRNIQFKEEYTPGNNQILKVVGGRDYSEPLHLPKQGKKHKDDYLTSSFWRYLAEEDYASRGGQQHQGSAATLDNIALPATENYEYLANFFNQPWGVHPGPAGQLTWLNKRMLGETHIRGSLAHLYPKFVASFADHMNKRIGPKLGPGSPDREHKWLEQIFTDCDSAGSVANGASISLNIRVKPIAARCFKVNVLPGALKKNVIIQAMHDDKSLLQQLQIGLPDGSDVRIPVIKSFNEDQPPHIAIWSFPTFFGNTGTYIISNVARNPASTKAVDLQFHLSTSDWDANMLALPPAGPPPPPPPADKKRPTQKKMQKEALDEIIKNPVENLQAVSRVERDRDKPTGNCEGLKLRLNLCGPQLEIKLSVSPFPGGQLDLTLSPATLSAQTATMLYGDLSNPMESMNAFQNAVLELDTALEGMDASKVNISVPLVDYGFSGSFQNARIKVSKANTKDHGYSAYGPSVGRYSQPPNGKVTITNYSHLAIEGTFSAGLVDESLRESTENPVVARTISGRFFIPAPTLYDRDFELSTEQMEEQMIQSMIQSAPFGTEVMQEIIGNVGVPPRALCEQGLDEAQIRAMGFKVGCSESYAQSLADLCSCECEARPKEEEIADCEDFCRNEWRQCPLPDHLMTDELAAQVAEYKRLLMSKNSNMPPEMQSDFIENFKKMPKWQRDLTLQGFK
jgi:hypothetical protein